MELVKADSKEVRAMDALEPSQKIIIRDLMTPKITSLDPLDAGKTIYLSLKSAEYDAGLSKMDDEDVEALTKTTWDLIRDYYPQLTINEFRTACKSGSIGQYGEWYGLCLKSVSQWIKGYLNHEGRINAIKEWNAKIGATSEVPVELKVARSKQGLVNYFHQYLDKNRLGLFAYRYFDLLMELSGPVGKWLTKDEQVKIKLQVEQEREKRIAGSKQVLESSGDMETADKIIKQVLDQKDDLLASKLKTAALKWIFDSLIAEGKELEV